MHIIIEGIDHCGKDTLINALQQKYGGYVIHSSKPVEIDAYSVENCKDTLSVYNSLYTSNSSMKYNPFGYINECTMKKNCALYQYQMRYFGYMFYSILSNPRGYSYASSVTDKKSQFHTFYNRFHLGEYVYGKLYRNYNIEMMNNVFNLEREILIRGLNTKDFENIHLILLRMHNTKLREYDNEAFDFDNVTKEQELFLEAFNKSALKKSIVYVDTADGKWKDKESILHEVEQYLFG